MWTVKNASESSQLLERLAEKRIRQEEERKRVQKVNQRHSFKEMITSIEATNKVENGLASVNIVYHIGGYLIKKL